MPLRLFLHFAFCILHFALCILQFRFVIEEKRAHCRTVLRCDACLSPTKGTVDLLEVLHHC